MRKRDKVRRDFEVCGGEVRFAVTPGKPNPVWLWPGLRRSQQHSSFGLPESGGGHVVHGSLIRLTNRGCSQRGLRQHHGCTGLTGVDVHTILLETVIMRDSKLDIEIRY